MIKALNGINIYIQRGEKPNWYNYAYKYNNANKLIKLLMEKTGKFSPYPNIFNENIHSSEYDWIGYNFDKINGTINNLYDTLIHYLTNTKLLGR